MMRYLFYALVWFVWALSAPCYGQEQFNFKHVTVDDGLSHSRVYCTYQDQSGKVWIGTAQGLNCYDGSTVTNYLNSQDSTSIGITTVYKICEDVAGNIWVAGTGGVNRFDISSNGFVRYKVFEDESVWSILSDSQGNLWVGNSKGLYYFDREFDEFIRLSLSDEFTKPDGRNLMADIFEIAEGKLVISTLNRMHVLDVNSNRLSVVLFEEDLATLVARRWFRSFYKDSNNRIWACSIKNGLFELVEEENGYILKRRYGDVFKGNLVRSIVEDEDKNLWVSTYKGLVLIRPNQEIVNIRPDNSNPSSLSNISVLTSMKDRNGNLWFGTYHGGVNIYRKSNNYFSIIRPRQIDDSIIDNVIRGIVSDKAGNIYFGTQASGVIVQSAKDKSLSSLDFPAIKETNIHCMCLDKTGSVWIGTHRNGIFRYNPVSKKLSKVKDVNPFHASISDMLCDSKGDIWVGTQRDGLYKYASRGEQFGSPQLVRKQETNSVIVRLYNFNDSIIFVGGSEGIVCVAKSNGEKLDRELFLKGIGDSYLGMISSIHVDKEENIWIGTSGNGLYRFGSSKESFKRFSTLDGLVNNNVQGIQEDKFGFIWISTNKGLMRFRKNFTDISVYNVNNGLPVNQFGIVAQMKDKNDRLYFGSINGAVHFNPEIIEEDNIASPVLITDVKVLNKSITYNMLNGQRYYDGEKWGDLKLKNFQNSFSIDFVTYYYGGKEDPTYEYRLKGLDKEWMKTRSRSVNYHSVPSGEYEFELRVAVSGGKWNYLEQPLKITVEKIWWITGEAIALYIVVLVVLFLLIQKVLADRMKIKNEIRLSSLEREKEKELNQLKLRFFTNVSHEFRTPLSLISGPLENLKEEVTNEDHLKLLDIASRNSQRLLQLVNNILDFRKAEQNFLKLKLVQSDIGAFIESHLNAFRALAGKRKIALRLEISDEVGLWVFDPDKMGSVLYNLISNALKYSDIGDEVTVRCGGKESLEISVIDTGKGIAEKDIERVFERFYQVEEQQESNPSSGIGLAFTRQIVELHGGDISVKSRQGKGSEFKIVLPRLSAKGIEQLERVDLEVDVALYDEPVNLEQVVGPETAPRILLVDDNTDLLAFVSDALKEEYRIMVAENGKEALSNINVFDPEIIISDVMMPEMNGLELCRLVKGDVETSHILMVLLTAKETLEDQEAGLESGADVYLSKPFSIRQLKAQLANLFKLRASQHKAIRVSKEIKTEKLSLSGVDKRFLDKAIELLKKHLDESDYGVNELSRDMGMSKSTLYRKVIALTGSGSSDFIKSIRLKEAADKLLHEDKTVAEIAYSVGFASPSYFGNCFKAEFGMSPGEYIKQNS
ncbi:response regulator [Puteibacter caeruleilacunae]|nr:response regulator [Puteibacter caeruleilacunae]